MNIGDLVTHVPDRSPIERILRVLDGAEEGTQLHPDFKLGVIVDQKSKSSRVFSHDLNDAYWYDNKELIFVE